MMCITMPKTVGYHPITVYYKMSDYKSLQWILFRAYKANPSPEVAGRPWAFNVPKEEFKLAAEAYRISLSHLFNSMLPTPTFKLEPLPIQTPAGYVSMLPRRRLQLLLAALVLIYGKIKRL
jgi:hypothetical protein